MTVGCSDSDREGFDAADFADMMGITVRSVR
jgi:hypothetical protein